MRDMACLYAVGSDSCTEIRAVYAQSHANSNREGTVAYVSSTPDANRSMISSRSDFRLNNRHRDDKDSISRRIVAKWISRALSTPRTSQWRVIDSLRTSTVRV